jgi:protein disulfide-isomerase A1
MKVTFVSLFLVICLYFASSNVEVLTTENFEDFISSHDRVLVEFYAPWCGHCKSLAPEYEKAAATLKSQNSETILAKVDATEEKDLATKFGIKGFPTLKYFTKDVNNPSEYTGGRTEQTIVSWLNKREMNALTNINDEESYKTYISKDNVVVTAFYPSDFQYLTILKEIADTIRENTLTLHVTNEQVAKNVGAQWNSLRLTVNTDGESSEVIYNGEWNVDAILKWINGERFPLIGEIGPENYKDYVDRGVPLVWIAIDPDDQDSKNHVINAVTNAAQVNKGKLSFVTIDAKKFAQHVQNLGMDTIPGLMLIKENDKYKYTNEITNDNVNKFFEDYNSGKLSKYLKTQSVPESNDESVFTLVGSQFHEVIGKDKDVFVEFYAPWCGHCKKLAPEWEKLGDAFNDVDNVIIAKIDATENDTPEDIKGFPTLIFYPKGQKQGIKYQGDRKAEDMIEWVKTQATVDITKVKTEL